MDTLEVLFENLIDQIEDLSLALIDAKGRVKYWSIGAEKNLGYLKSDFSDLPISKLFTNADQFLVNLENITAGTSKTSDWNCWLINKIGEAKWHHIVLKKLQQGKHEYLITFKDISDQKVSEKISDQIIENALDAIVCIDPTGCITEWNPSAAKIFGWKKPEIIGKLLSDTIMPSKHAANYHSKLRPSELITQSSVINQLNEVTALKKDGSLITIELTVVPFEQNGPRAYCGFIRDITQRKNRETERINREKRFRTLIENGEDVIITADTNGLINYASPSIYKILGYTETECSQIHLQTLIAFEDRDTIVNYLSTANGDHVITAKAPIRLLHKNGSSLWMSFTVSYLQDDPLIGGIVFNFRDITDRINANRKISEQEKYFRALVEYSTDMIVLTNKERQITYLSTAFKQITGYTDQDVIGHTSLSFMHPVQQDESKDVYDKLMKNPGKPFLRTNRLRKKDGSYIWVEGVVINLLQENNINSVITNYRDITERIIFEEKIIKLNRVYAFISQINQAIVRVQDEQSLFEEVCLIAVETGQFKMAWIGEIDKTAKKIKPLNSAGSADNYLHEISTISIENKPEGNGPTGRAAREGRSFYTNDIATDPMMEPWRDHALKRQYRSSIALPLRKTGKITNILTMYSSIQDFFDEEEIALLESVTSDISFALDIFEKERMRQQIQDQLTRSETSLKKAQELAHVGSWELDLETRSTRWTDEARRIYGITDNTADPTVQEWMEFVHPDDRKYVADIIEDAKSSLKDASFTNQIIRGDGSIRIIHTQSHYQIDKNKKNTILFGVFHDVTEIRQSEETLKHSEANLRQIIDLIPHIIFTRDLTGNIVMANKSYAELFGLSPEELVNRNRNEFNVNESHTVRLLDLDRQVIQTGNTLVIPDVVFEQPNKPKRYYNTIKAPFTPVGINEITVLTISNDVTNVKLAEMERNKVVEDILRRNKDLEQFSYIISHNLRAPVANILGLIGLLHENNNSEIEQRYLMTELQNSIMKLDTVIKDLNNILNIGNLRNEIREPVSFAGIVRDIETSIDMLIKQENAKISCNFNEVGGMTTIKSYLYSVFLNLITNSIKYRQHHIDPAITINSHHTPESLVLTFQDNGLGFNLEKNKHSIFGMYKRFHTHKEGKGMGLFMVKTQVEAMGGAISLDSKINSGSQFTITFPKEN